MRASLSSFGSIEPGNARQCFRVRREVGPRINGATKELTFFFFSAGELASRLPLLRGIVREDLAKHKVPGGASMVIEQWQAYVQQVVNLFSHGYFYFCNVSYPREKAGKWRFIDQKLIAKYDTEQDKDRKYRNRKKGLANYMLVRHEHQCLLLRTEGKEKDVPDPDHWQDVRCEPYYFRYGTIMLKIRNVNGKVDVRLEKRCYRDIKGTLAELIARKPFPMDYVVRTFHLLNGFPSYSGIIAQKIMLQKYVIAEAKRHHGRIASSDLWVNTNRKIYRIKSI